jgi:hypothetical protein
VYNLLSPCFQEFASRLNKWIYCFPGSVLHRRNFASIVISFTKLYYRVFGEGPNEIRKRLLFHLVFSDSYLSVDIK